MRKFLITMGILSTIVSAYGASARKFNTKADLANSKMVKKVMQEKREDLFESLEEKVFRASNGSKSKLQATDIAFDIGNKRMYYLQNSEDQIRALESELGMEEIDHNFLTEKYNNVMEAFKTTKNEIESLEIENKKLKEYFTKLNTMENRAKGK